MTRQALAGLHRRVHNVLAQQPRRLQHHAQCEGISQEQARQQCLSVAYIAAQEGIPVKRAIAQLFDGVGSVAHDARGRANIRLDGASVEQYRWDAWRPPAAGTRLKRETRTVTDPVWNRDIVDQMVLEEEHRRVCAVIRNTLTPRDAELVFAHYHDGLSQTYLAKVYRMSAGSVNVVLHRARTVVQRIVSHAAMAQREVA